MASELSDSVIEIDLPVGRQTGPVPVGDLLEQVDDDGFLHAGHVERAWDLLALWTAARQGPKPPRDLPKGRFAGLLRYVLRLMRPDGRLPWEPAGASKSQTAALLRAAVECSGDRQCRAIAAAVLKEGRGARPAAKRSPRLPAAAAHSEAAATALLRSGWSPADARLTVLYNTAQTRIELSRGANVLLAGPWTVEVTAGGRALPPQADWRQVCWVSDAKVDYLELELALAEGYRVQRQILLAHQDRFALLADVVLGPRPGAISYWGCLPAGPAAALRGAGATRELRIKAGKAAATVLPLSLPEWRTADDAGELAAAGKGPQRAIQLRQAATGRGLHAALFVDLDPRRQRSPLTWRQLTVAENRRRMPPDAAVGYRVMIGRRQWLFYRSLAPRGNRTLLGHNLSTEMLAGRFSGEGKVETLVEIE